MFKQQVTTDDVFLGMSGKNSSTACCEDLLVCMILLIPCNSSISSFVPKMQKL